MAKAIPDRWLNYNPIGERVPGTRFIAFKVPLHENVNARVEEKLRLAPESLMESVPNLGLIIDLTNTNRYYHPNAFAANDVRHQKLMIPGKQTPPRALAEKFCGFVADFLASNADNDKLIGVHCTHGVNRTGYLICYFMITMMKKSPKEAIETFAAARGHEIERQNYMSSLKDLTQKDEKQSSIESDGSGKSDSKQRSSYRKESGDRWQRDYQRHEGYQNKYNRNQNHNYRKSYQNWRTQTPKPYFRSNGYQRESNYHRDNRSPYQNHQRYDRSHSAHSSHRWQDYKRDNYPREDHHYHYDGSNWQQDREERQDNRSRGYDQNYYQNHHRDERRRSHRSRRHRDSDVE
ncbi:RNA/RNP complex-1-interacting phosphatase homolog isoform X2 [Drosophila kikkawai]|uniref:RNA/RNP complex-1-interacting phosphatase homolog isoform X2 n=1 Tax=Drosophila kikkawai TaxID=30033 RepID=A0A6P4HVD8_DROKI|nr:RNA/RNP complex-1-interacting phosphatase homolog isoform X2 [Drosophila kikkawai]